MATAKKKKSTAATAASTKQLGGVSPSEVLSDVLRLHNRLMVPFSTYIERQHKISINEFRMLMTIGRIGITASHELADHTGLNAMGVSRAVNLLHRHGRIVFEVDPDNRRRKSIRLTAKGQTLYNQLQPASLKVAQFLFKALRPDEIMAFDHFVKTLIQQLEATDEAGRSLFLEQTRPNT